MKKLFSGVLAGVLASAAVFSLAACGGKEKVDRNAPAFADAQATLTVDATPAKAKISDSLFGLFLEDINYAAYALDDNIVANGSFDMPKPGTTWKLTDNWKVGGGVTLTAASAAEERIVATNESYASVGAKANGTLTNIGHKAVPMAIEKGTDYLFSAYVKSPKAFDLTVTLRSGTADAGSVVIPIHEDSGWIKYCRTIKASETASTDVALELAFGADASIELDCVTLETTDSTVGIKNYLYKALEDLSPAFFRFPGGCIIEGKDMETAYDWKNSIGAQKGTSEDEVPAYNYKLDTNGTVENKTGYGLYETRAHNTNLWNVNNADHKKTYYTMDYGIGFYEYFLLCESLGAGAVPIVNIGWSCQIQTPDTNYAGAALAGRYGNGVDDYIQDALDLIAFAKGDPNSSDPHEAKWATVRKNMGHPAPFEMNYIGIGNEQWDPKYYDRYEKFLEALQKEAGENKLYASVRPIVGNGTVFTDCEKFDEEGNSVRAGLAKSRLKNYCSGKALDYSEYGVVDHHYYMGSVDFLSNTHFYDKYPRIGSGGYGVFVGEYSANNNANAVADGYKGLYDHINNSVLTALAEAAYMTGLERNGDVVELAAYAPMYGIANETDYGTPGNHWIADMMFYTNTELVLTPNYFVQQIFMQNTGTRRVTEEELSFAEGAPTTTFTGKYSKDDSRAVSTTVDNVYEVVTYDEATKDVIVKFVNIGEENVDVNVKLSGRKVTGTASACYIAGESLTDVSSIERGDAMYLKREKIGVGSTFGYRLKPFSVTVIRVKTK